MLTAIVMIGIVIALVIAALLYCVAMENEKPNYKEKYMNQLKINKELLDEVLRANEEDL